MRLALGVGALLLPLMFLWRGIYGSFLFTFSVAFLWQFCVLGQPLSSLGLRRDRLGLSLIAGLLSGLILGLLGGNILRWLDINGQALTNKDTLQFALGSFNFDFSVRRELLYLLLTRTYNFRGLVLYLMFSILLVGLGEEIFWRGFIQTKLAARFSKNTGIWLTAGLFGLAHFYLFLILPLKEGLLFLSIIALAGAGWGYMFNYFRNVWCLALSHGITAFIIWKYYFFAI